MHEHNYQQIDETFLFFNSYSSEEQRDFNVALIQSPQTYNCLSRY